jgi:hypothetical protein
MLGFSVGAFNQPTMTKDEDMADQPTMEMRNAVALLDGSDPTPQNYFPDMPAGFIAFGKHLVQISNITQIIDEKDGITIHYIGGEFLSVTGVDTLQIAGLLAETRRGFPSSR